MAPRHGCRAAPSRSTTGAPDEHHPCRTRPDATAFARLEAEGRLLNPVLKARPRSRPLRLSRRTGAALCAQDGRRGAPARADLRPGHRRGAGGNPKLPFFAGYLLSFEHLKDVAEVLGDTLSAGGKYFLFCNNIDLSKKYQVA
jgi:hypothetical protein